MRVFKQTAEQYGVWTQIRTLAEIAGLAIVLLAGVAYLAIERAHLWYIPASILAVFAAVFLWVVAKSIPLTIQKWDEAELEYRQSDEHPTESTLYTGKEVA